MGEHDHLATPAQAQRLTKLLPRAQCLPVLGAGHAIFIDARDAVVQAIRDLTALPEYDYSPANDVDGEITAIDTDNADITAGEATDPQIADEVAAATFGHGGNTDDTDNADVTDR
jgi:hypothetical protein